MYKENYFGKCAERRRKKGNLARDHVATATIDAFRHECQSVGGDSDKGRGDEPWLISLLF